jgi:hypothetical protein
MSHTNSNSSFLRKLSVTGLAMTLGLALISELWASGPPGSRPGNSGSSSSTKGSTTKGSTVRSANPPGKSTTTRSATTTRHNTHSAANFHWSRRGWCPSLNCWVYWSPSDGCWYVFDSAAGTYIPCEGWTNEFISGIQSGQ